MVTPVHTADFLEPKEDSVFPFKNTFFSAGRNILKTNIFILSGNYKQPPIPPQLMRNRAGQR